jgi:hypothetical protein
MSTTAAAPIGLTVWLLVRSSTHAAETPPPAQSHTSSSTVQLPAACHPRRVGAYLPC